MTLVFIIVFSILSYFSILNLIPKVRFLLWKRALRLNKHSAIFQRLYTNTNGFEISRIVRKKSDAIEYTYGEIEFVPFIALLSLTKPNTTSHFFDLGSGVGKAVISCAMVFDMEHYYGVELFQELHDEAAKLKKHLHSLKSYANQANKITLVCDNFLNIDLSKATHIYINSTAFFGETWEKLNQKLAEVSPETIVITTSKRLIAPEFKVIHATKVLMSWGVSYAFIHERIEWGDVSLNVP